MSETDVEGMNVVLLRGRLARPAEMRELPSGTRLVTYELTVPRKEKRSETVALSWFDAPAWASGLDAGTTVIATGRVRRRFFRVGTVTRSRTEVVLTRLAPLGATRRVRTVLAAVRSELSGAEWSDVDLC